MVPALILFAVSFEMLVLNWFSTTMHNVTKTSVTDSIAEFTATAGSRFSIPSLFSPTVFRVAGFQKT